MASSGHRNDSIAIANWERLYSALHRDPASFSGRFDPSSTIVGFVPTSLGQSSNVDSILQVANEIQLEDPNVARILCEHAYSLSHNLDPNSEGRGVLQFKTGLMSVIKQKLVKKSGVIDRRQDAASLEAFYTRYRNKHKVEELRRKESLWREGKLSLSQNALQQESLALRKAYATLAVLKNVIYARSQEPLSPEFEAMLKSDAAKTAEFKPYNILPLDAPGISDPIMSLSEVKAALNSLSIGLQFELPDDYEKPVDRKMDVFDVLEYIFGFQNDNANNQREHFVLLLASAQSRVGLPTGELRLDQTAIDKVCERILDNYLKWCEYIHATPVYSRSSYSDDRPSKLLLTSLYLLIWGEAANIRFLPECLCYIYHQMAKELRDMLKPTQTQSDASHASVASHAKSCMVENNGPSFLNKVIVPIYNAISEEASKNKTGKYPHSKWRNYDDFNEYFWSKSCLELPWPLKLNSPFFLSKGRASLGKSSFVEHRTYLHLYHSFHRLWIFLVLAFQGLAIIAFSSSLSIATVKGLLSLGPTFVLMKFFQSILDVFLMIGAYTNVQRTAISRIVVRFFWFGALSGLFTWMYILVLKEDNDSLLNSLLFKIYIGVLGILIVFQFFIALLLRVPGLRARSQYCDNWAAIRFIKWMHQEHYYVGRGLYEKTQDYLKYVCFWIVVLACKFSFSYFMQIKPLASPTKTIVGFPDLTYTWHDIVSEGNHNALTILALWAPVVLIYLLDIQIWYTIISSVVGGLVGTRERLGEIRSLEVLRNSFNTYPDEFVKKFSAPRKGNIAVASSNVNDHKANAARFAPFWNEIVASLREEDYISNREKELLMMPHDTGYVDSIQQWPLFLLVSKIFKAVELAEEHQGDNQKELMEKISRDPYMFHAVTEVYESLKKILRDMLSEKDRKWLDYLDGRVNGAIADSSFLRVFRLKKLMYVQTRVTALMGLLVHKKTPELEKGAMQALLDFYDVVTHDILPEDSRTGVDAVADAKKANSLFTNLNWPDSRATIQIRRLYQLLTIKESAASVPKNLEARRRLQFFTNSLFMNVPPAKHVREMRPFSVFTPYYAEDVMYTDDQLRKRNEDGISILFYLQKIFKDEFTNFLERINYKGEDPDVLEKVKDPKVLQQLRLWASYRGQTLARTVRGMMYYRRALMLQSFLELSDFNDFEEKTTQAYEKYKTSPLASALADLKFTYVVTCQIYGQQKQKQDHRANDILFLMQMNDGLRVAFIDTVEVMKDKKVHKEYYSKLVKADVNGKDQEIYKIKLPGDPKLGEGKPENQNHAIVFTRGEAVQTIDMNQDNYLEEAFKMRNLLEEFGQDHGLHRPTILGVREHVFTGSVSSLAWFMSNQEGSFVTLGQRVLATPLKVRMHYGHPDVFDRIFHITRGGISKASRIINISEDIYAGFNSTLRQGNITHHEYIQVGKGRDVGLNQIAMFEGKVSGGNGEQTLSRDVYRLGQLFDFFRMLSFYVTSVGFYVCTMMTVLTVYAFLYGKAYLAFSGIGAQLQSRSEVTRNTALQSALETQFLFQIGVFTAIPMVMGFILEQGFFKAIINFITMQLQLCSVFFTFSLGTRTHYFGRTILHGGAKYRATGRGFVVQHIKFAENYRLYSRSHFVKGLEIAILLIVLLVYGFEETTLGYILLSFSSWFLAISWLFAPYIFNPAGFEWQKTVEDFTDWTNWLFYKGGVGVKGEESWETWWDEEQEHIHSLRGKILETILSLRFFFFQYGVVYQLSVANGNTSLAVYGISWLVILGIILLFKVFTFSQKSSVNFQMFLRLIQGVVFVVFIVTLVLLVILTRVSIGDLFASFLALLPTGWGILSIAIAWRGIIKKLGLWKSIRTIARFFDAMMGLLIFFPIVVLSWFPFVSTFQSRLLFNQAFSRGLEISLILAGNQANARL